jgi:hypothetical protein
MHNFRGWTAVDQHKGAIALLRSAFGQQAGACVTLRRQLDTGFLPPVLEPMLSE